MARLQLEKAKGGFSHETYGVFPNCCTQLWEGGETFIVRKGQLRLAVKYCNENTGEVVWCRHTIDGTKTPANTSPPSRKPNNTPCLPEMEEGESPSPRSAPAPSPSLSPPGTTMASRVAAGRLSRSTSRRESAASSSALALQQTQTLQQQPLQQEQQDKKAAATQLPRVMPTLEPAELPRLLHEHGAASTSVAEYVAWRMRGLSTLETQELASCGGIYAILEVMRAHPANVSIQEDCCGAFARFSACDSGCRDSVIASGAVGQIQQAMSAHRTEAELQEAAIASLATISVGDEPSEGSVVATCLPAVVDAMRTHPHRLDLQRSGCSLLYYISAGSDEGRTEVCSAKGIEAVASAMRAHPECMSLLADGCGTLCSLVLSDDPRCAYAVVAMRAVDAVVEAMLAAPASAPMQRWGCLAICSVANGHIGGGGDGDGLFLSSAADRVRAVVRAMDAHPSEAVIQEQGCGALWGVAAASELGRRSVADVGAEACILAAMRRHASLAGVQEQACGALCAFCSKNADAHARVVRGGAVASAHEALLAHPHGLSVQRTAISLLAILAAFDESVAAHILTAGAPYAAVTAIGEHPNDAGLLRAACHLLLASWPFDLPSPDLPTGEGSADEAAAAREQASVMGRTVEVILRSIRGTLNSRPRSAWFAGEPHISGDGAADDEDGTEGASDGGEASATASNAEGGGGGDSGGGDDSGARRGAAGTHDVGGGGGRTGPGDGGGSEEDGGGGRGDSSSRPRGGSPSSSLSSSIEAAFAVLVQLASRGDSAARAQAMEAMGCVQLLTDTLLAASECGLLLPHAQELGALLARSTEVQLHERVDVDEMFD